MTAESVDWAEIHPVAMTMSDPAIQEVRDATDEGSRILCGSFVAPIEGMAGEAHGWVGGILNVATRDVVDLWRAVAGEGDLVRARAEMRGAVVGHCRAPLPDLIAAQRDKLRASLEPAGLVPAG